MGADLELSVKDNLDELITRALATANLNALRVALYQATGDTSLLKMKVEKRSVWGHSWIVTTLAAHHHDEVREKARRFLKAQKVDRAANSNPSDEQLRAMIAAFSGDEVQPTVLRWGREELALNEETRFVKWRKPMDPERLASFHAVIVGAGMSGIAMALQFKQLGLPFTIIERQNETGGTWSLNTYPGARVDVPSHHYEFSFVKNYPWKSYFATQEELNSYLKYCCDEYDLNDNIHLNREVESATWDAAQKRWEIVTKDVNTGQIQPYTADIMVSASGVFHTPNIPDLDGLEAFDGKIFHTTQWDHSVDIDGLRIGLIGNGSTGVQLMPQLARKASRLSVFQRTASWMMPLEGYFDAVPDGTQWLFDNMPYYRNWYRFGLFYTNVDDVASLQEYDREWQKSGGRISRRHDGMSEAWEAFLRDKFADRPDLLQKCLPSHLPWAKRPIVESGWYDCLRLPNVELVTETIEQVTSRGILTSDGIAHELDVIVLGAGFKATEFLWPASYVGRDGVALGEMWADDGARAYLGVTMPNFPNLFMMYGPNGQPRTIGIFAWSELWSRYIASCVREMLEGGFETVECRRDRFATYNQALDERMERLIWTHPGQTNYYVNQWGRVGLNMPWNSTEYFEMIESPEFSDYDFS
jgi:4-hydroxyacetophenone monooxygenase